jgi:hypothetical protein
MINDSALDLYLEQIGHYLEGKQPEDKKQILDRVVRIGVEPDDPILPVLTLVSSAQQSAEEIPVALDIACQKMTTDINAIFESIDSRVNLLTNKLVVQQQDKIVGIVEKVMEKKVSWQWRKPQFIFPIFGLVFGIYALGFATGILFSKSFENQPQVEKPKLKS